MILSGSATHWKGFERSLCSSRKRLIAAYPFHPTSASWLNAVEGFFAILTKRRLKRGVFRSVADLL